MWQTDAINIPKFITLKSFSLQIHAKIRFESFKIFKTQCKIEFLLPGIGSKKVLRHMPLMVF